MKFTLLIATLNRYELLKKCIDSLLEETYSNFEIIIVDQTPTNSNSELNLPVDERIKYYHIEKKGLSHARNVGIIKATGDYICLIDDDGEYERTYLEKAKNIIDSRNPTILGGQIVDPITNSEKWGKNERVIRYKDAFNCFCSPGMIIEAKFQKGHLYDESFGVGSKYGSGEETDIVLSALSEGKLVFYSPSIITKHPADMLSSVNQKKIESYAFGYGALCRKIFKKYSKFWGFYHLFKTIIGNYVIGYIQFNTKKGSDIGEKRLARAKSIICGYKDYKKEIE